MSSKLSLKKCCTFLVMAFFMFTSVYAQQLRVSGKVTDASTNESLPGVNVAVKGTMTGTSTDANGNYSISVNSGTVLVFSFLGYTAQEVTVGAVATVNVALQPEATELGEVVVTALGIRKDVKRIGFSVQKVTNQELAKVSPPTLAVGLMGKAAGVNVTQPNGLEGGSQRIVIRGNNSLLGNNQPLIIVDGIQMSDGHMGLSQSNGSGYNIRTGSFTTPDLGGAQTDWGSSLNFFNSEDIEDINILKGPTAAALYGARGANGVILITTKKSAEKQGFGVEYNFSTRWNQAYLFQDYQDEYGFGGANGMWSATDRLPKDANGNLRYPGNAPWSGAGVPDKYVAFGPIPGGYNWWDQFSWPGPGLSWGAKMEGQEIVWWDGVKRPYSPTPDANKSFFRTGNTTSHNVAFGTAGDFGGVRVSLNRTDNTAIVPNSNFDQTSANIGANLNLSKKLKLETVAGYTRYNRLNTPSIGDNNSISKFLVYAFPGDYMNIEKDVYKMPDGSKNKFDTGTYPLAYPYEGYGSNIYWYLMEQNKTLQRDQLVGSVKLNAEITPWLSLMARTGADYATNEFETKNTPIDAAGYQGQYGYELNRDFTMTAEALATAHKTNLFSGFDASLSVGTSTWYNHFVGSSAFNNGPFANPNLYYLSNTTATVSSSWLPTYYRLESQINSVFSLMDLSYKNYLFLQLTGRNDWSSTLPVDNNSYFYPSASLSFVFSEAFNMGSVENWLDFGKIRLAYAQSANGTDPYKTQNIFGSSTFGGVVTRYLPSTLQPTFLKPQRSASYEIGTQLAFLENRLSFDLTYYSIKSTDQILSGPLPWSTGVSSAVFNTGELQNNGIEFIIRGTPVRKTKVEWNIALNAAHNQNKVIALGEGIEKFYLGTIFGLRTGVSMYVEEGQNYGTIYGLDYQYKDGQKVVAKIWNKEQTQVVGTRYVTTKDPVPIGNATPFLTGGLSNNLRFKNFSLYLLTDFKLGGDIYSMDYASAMGEGKSPSTLLERNGGGLPFTYPDGTTANHGVILEGVYEDGTPNTDVVHYMYKYAGQYCAWSNVDMPRSNAVFENTWIKLREISLTYDIPSKITSKTKVFQGLSISLIGRDLFYFYKTLPDNLNPEGISGVGNMQGMQWAAFPGTRSVGFSIKAKF